MTSGGRTPEELGDMFEDALILRDGQALAALFQDRAVVIGRDARESRGHDEIVPALAALWDGDAGYLPDGQQVVQAGDTALSLGRAVHVLHRDPNGLWRYVISIFGSKTDSRRS